MDKTLKKEKTLLCIKCDSYFPSKPWLKGVVYTGKCNNCAKTLGKMRKTLEYRYANRNKEFGVK